MYQSTNRRRRNRRRAEQRYSLLESERPQALLQTGHTTGELSLLAFGRMEAVGATRQPVESGCR